MRTEKALGYNGKTMTVRGDRNENRKSFWIQQVNSDGQRRRE